MESKNRGFALFVILLLLLESLAPFAYAETTSSSDNHDYHYDSAAASNPRPQLRFQRNTREHPADKFWRTRRSCRID